MTCANICIRLILFRAKSCAFVGRGITAAGWGAELGTDGGGTGGTDELDKEEEAGVAGGRGEGVGVGVRDSFICA